MPRDGDLVELHLHGTLDSGAVFDNSRGRRPRVFVLGRGQLLPAFEAAIKGMTPGETKEATALIRQIARSRGLTVLLIEHDMSVVMGISDRIAVLHFGEKIAEGSPEAIRSDPKVIDACLGGAED